MTAVRRLAVCLACCGVGLVVAPVAVSASGPARVGRELPGHGVASRHRAARRRRPRGHATVGHARRAGHARRGHAAPVAARMAGAVSAGGLGSLSGSPLVVPAAEALVGGQMGAAEEAKLANPEAVSVREESRTKFEGLSGEQAEKLAGEVFPSVVDEPAGGPPKLPAGESIAGFPIDNAAQIVLPGGGRGVIESTEPMAIESSPGHRVPVDLSVSDVGGAFEPKTPVVGVRIPERLSEGVQVPSVGVSLTPVSAQRSSLADSEGALDGAGVFFANAQADSDVVVKATTFGFQIDTLLRSVASPSQLSFRVGLPEGASLAQSEDGSGALLVVKEGAAIATIPAPSARDAVGTLVPVSMSASGDILTLAVSDGSGEYQYPIEVDPELKHGFDEYLTGKEATDTTCGAGPAGTNWKFCAHEVSKFTSSGWGSGGDLTDNPAGKYVGGEGAYFSYQTQGDSQIYYGKVSAQGSDTGANVETYIEMAGTGGEENKKLISSGSYGPGEYGLCANRDEEHCFLTEGTEYGTPGNWFHFVQNAYGSGESFSNTIWDPVIAISQPTGPSVSFNTTSPTLPDGQPNVLYGSGGWFGPNSGAFEVKFSDPGVGVAQTTVHAGNGDAETGNIEKYYLGSGLCSGIQCEPSQNEIVTYSGLYHKELFTGHVGLEAHVVDAVGLHGEVGSGLHLDSTPPGEIRLLGIRESGAEITATPHEVTVEATDRMGSEENPGMRSIKVAVDGEEIGQPQGSTSPCWGGCTGSGKWTINGESMGAGVHHLVVTATDNAGNEAKKEYTFSVRNATPVTVGPGTVDPVTGQFALSATDVNLSGVAGVSRTYESRHLTAGAEGPLGPQWAIGLGGASESLSVLADGSVTLTASNGGSTTFIRNEEGEFESPKGDQNLTVVAKENENGQITEYLLKDATQGTTTEFKQPEGSQSVAPTFAGQFGSSGTGGGGLSAPVGMTVDTSGDVWVVDSANNRVQEFSAGGLPLKVFGEAGAGNGQFSTPYGIAINKNTGNVYVSDRGDSRIEEFYSSGEYDTKFGSYGTGAGDLSSPSGVSVDSSGNIWVADLGNNRVEEFSSTGTFIKTFGFGVSNGKAEFEVCTSGCQAGLAGSGSGQFNSPSEIAFSGGDVYVTDYNNDRVEVFNEKGEYLRAFGSLGSGDGQFSHPYGIATEPSTGNLYVADEGNHRVQEFTSGGTFVASFGSEGSGNGQFSDPDGVAVSSSGAVYVGDAANDRIEAWKHSVWLPELAQGPAVTSTDTYTYRAVTVEGKTVVEPTEELGPKPPGVECPPEPTKAVEGCRELTFKYATATTAYGENPTEWGEYKGRLVKILFTAYNPATKKMVVEQPVAQYSYDKQGRLRAERDPRISPELKTTYGYDSEGHVTALTPPGEQGWVFTYGTIVGDSNTGRLLKVTRAQPSGKASEKEIEEKLHEQELQEKGTEAPKLSGSSFVGARMAVSTGVWSASPVVYGYQWEECNSSGTGCKPILGATNANYTPTAGNEGHKLVAVVTATNGGGSVTVSSASSGVVGSEEESAPSYSSVFGSSGRGAGELNEPADLKVDVSGDVWVADEPDDRVEEFNSKGEFVRQVGSEGAGDGELMQPYGLAFDSNGNLWIGDTGNDRVEEFTSEGVFIKAIGWGVSNGEAKLEVCTTACRAGIVGSGSGQFNTPEGLAVNGAGDVFVADRGNKRIEELTTEGVFVRSITNSAEPEGPSDVVLDSSGDLWTTYNIQSNSERIDEFSSEGSLLRSWGSHGSESGKLNAPERLTVGPGGDIWLAEYGNSRVQVFSPAGTYLYGFGAYGSGAGQMWHARGIAIYGSSVYVLDSGEQGLETGNNRIEKWLLKPEHGEGELHAPEPGSTIEYRVPVSGAGLLPLTREEVDKWGQTDNNEQEDNDPVEGMAIFPPDEPQGWPASGYKRATIDYLNNKALTVDTVSPAGGISTTEYNGINEVTRTLSPDNRAAAMKETGKTVEAAELLDTKTEYNPEETEIIKILGPQHTVKLKSGAEVQARDDKHYYYDEYAPGGETYRLVTKTVDAALESGKEEDKRITETSYSGQEDLGWKLRKPTSVTSDPGGLNLTGTTVYEENAQKESTGEVVETTTPGGKHESESESKPPSYSSVFGSSGRGAGELNEPADLKVDVSGDVWVADEPDDRVEEFNSKGEFVRQVGSEGAGDGELMQPYGLAFDSNGNLWIGDTGNDRVEEFTSEGVFIKAIGWGVSNGEAKLEVCTTACRAGIVGSGSGQFNTPEGLAVNGAGDVFVADRGNKRIEELTTEGVFVRSITNSAEPEGPSDVVLDSSGDLWTTYNIQSNSERIDEFSSEGSLLRSWGSHGSESGKLNAPERLTVGPGGDIWLAEYGNSRVQVFSPAGTYLYGFGAYGSGAGQMWHARGIAIYGSSVYVLDSGEQGLETGNNRIEKWLLPSRSSKDAPDTHTIYYTAEANAEDLGCGKHPEWAGLPCQTEPVAQPGASGLPELPITTTTYNIWDAPETVTETVGSGAEATTRTKKETFDGAGREISSEVFSPTSTDAKLPKVADEYNEKTGALEKQSTTTEGKARTITSKYNTLGQLVKYTDAAGGTTTYAYEEGGDDRLDEVSFEGPEGEKEREKGYQTYSYNATTGFMEKLVDSAAGTFAASYDVEGKMTSEVYPNGVCANTTYSSVGIATDLEYIKTRNCSEKSAPVLFSDADVPSIHGETLRQTSTLSKENNAYDEIGRLAEAQETPTGKGCKSRLYAYNEESDRTSETTRESATETCPSEGGMTEAHSYDTANRLIDPGVTYETLGNITKLPAVDAGGYALSSTYFVDGQVETQKQDEETESKKPNERTIGYTYDPAGRAMETFTENTEPKSKSIVISHYAGPGAALAWTCEEEDKKECAEGKGKWTRNIPGIDGALDAIQTSAGTTTLQLHDLQGNIVGEVAGNEAEAKLLKPYNSTEFGVPSTSSAPKYSWLGAGGVASELPSSGVSTQGGASYVPQVARDLQTEAVVPPGAFGNGSGPGSPYITAMSPETIAQGTAALALGPEREAERLKAQAEETRGPTTTGGISLPGGEAGPLGGSEGWTCEDAAVTGQEVPGCFFYFGQYEASGGEENAVAASSLMSSLEGILKGGVKGSEIAWSALEAGGRFVARNAGKFLAMMHDVTTIAEASLALTLGATACVAGAVGASVVAPYAAPFVWFGCGVFILGNSALIGWSAYDLYQNASHIH